MNKKRWDKVETIVDEALALPAEQQKSFILKKCGDDQQLYSSVTELLQSINDSEGFMENPGEDQDELLKDFARDIEQISAQTSMVGTQIGNYRISKLLGQGGMGNVYLAERADGAFQHRVAVKLVRRGMDTAENIGRFQRERAILANLNHRNIARMYDGGLTDEGLPYLIMEFIDGQPIDEYCQAHNCSFDERLDLFQAICEAVEHAHQNLAIHRDLKPGNILVTNNGEVKILDFGIAKLLEAEDSRTDFFETSPGRNLLTLAYAAPEQITSQPVTTATDIYTLGVLFYELMCGQHPFDVEDQTPDQLRQQLKEQDPRPPSSRQSTYSNKLRGDLDAIILKTLRKEPGARYGSVGELLEDLNRYRQELPVSAHEGSLRYNATKFLKRHRASLSVASLLVVLILGFAIFYTYQITEERNLARLEATKASQVQNFLVELFQANNPELKQYSGKNLPAVALLDQGLTKIERELADQPVIQAEIMFSIYDAYENLEQYETAHGVLNKLDDLVRSHYGDDHLQYARLLSERSTYSREVGDLKRAIEMNERATAIYRKELGTSSVYYGDMLAQRGLNYAHSGKYEEAKRNYERADSIFQSLNLSGDDRIRQINNISNLAEIYLKMGEYEKALKTQLTTISAYKEIYSGPHTNIATTHNKVGVVQEKMGDFKGAITSYEHALDIYRELLPPESLDMAASYNKLGLTHWQIGNLVKAKDYCERSVEIRMKILGKKHEDTMASLNNLALINKRAGNYEEARNLFEEVIEAKKQMEVVNEPSLAVSLYNLADLLHETGQDLDRAHQLHQQVVKIDTTNYGADHPTVALDLNKLGAVQRDLGMLAEAERTFAKAGAIFDAKFPPSHLRIADFKVNLARLEIEKRNFQLARQHIDEAIEVYRTNELGEDDSRLMRSVALRDEISNELGI